MRSAQADPASRYDLSERQREVLDLIARGRTNPEIARELGISLDGVKYHVREILGRLDVTSREEAAALWRRSDSLASRFRRTWAGMLAPLIAHPVVVFAGVGLLAAGMAAVAIAVVVGGDNGGAASVADVTRTPAGSLGTDTPSPGASPGATATATETGTAVLAPCVPDQPSVTLDLVQDGDDVLVRVLGAAAATCRIEGTATLQVVKVPSDPPSLQPPFANVNRQFQMQVDLPRPDVLKEWRWTNWCGDPPSGMGWHMGVLGQVSTVRAIDTAPACVDASAPTTLVSSSAAPGVSDDVPPVQECTNAIPGWLCEFAARAEFLAQQRQQQPSGLERLIDGLGVSSYTCGPDGTVIGFEYSDLCRGKGEGEAWNGYPLTLHGSEGGPVSREALVERFMPLLVRSAAQGGPSLISTVGCPVDDPGCNQFILAWETGTQPAVAYFVFRLWPGNEPTVIGAGLSGDNADTILEGGVTTTGLGATKFVPFRR